MNTVIVPSVRKDSFMETNKPETWSLWGRGDETSFTSHYWIYHLLIFATILLILGVSSYTYCTCKVHLECIECCNMLALLQMAVRTSTQILYPRCSFQKTDISKMRPNVFTDIFLSLFKLKGTSHLLKCQTAAPRKMSTRDRATVAQLRF